MFVLFSLAVPLWGIVPNKYNLEYEKEFVYKMVTEVSNMKKCNKCLTMKKKITLLSCKHFKWYLRTFLNAYNYYKNINK